MLISLLGAGCGATPVIGFTCDAECEAAFSRVTAVHLSSGGTPSGSFELTRDGLTQRTTFSTGNFQPQRGAVLTREQLAPLWRVVGAPDFVLTLQAFRDTRTTMAATDVRHCLGARRPSGAGATACWRGATPAGEVGRAWDESVRVFSLAFPE